MQVKSLWSSTIQFCRKVSTFLVSLTRSCYETLVSLKCAQTIGRVIRVDKQDAQDIADGVLPPCVNFIVNPVGMLLSLFILTMVTKLSKDCKD